MRDHPRAPDTFRIRLANYDSGEQRIHDGDVDVECDDDDDDDDRGRERGHKKAKT